jgi:nucleoid DNA-binding protein
MKKREIAKRMATQAGVSQGEAADRLDRMVGQILSNARQGKETPLPGLGKFTQGPEGQVVFQPEGGKRRDPHSRR